MAAKKQLKKPTAQKVNKEALPKDGEAPIVENKVYRCPRCGHGYVKQEGNFSPSKSPLYKGNNGYMVFCRKCVAEIYEEYLKFFDNDEDSAMERVCQLLDLAVDEKAWDAARKLSPGGRRINNYISKLNLNRTNMDYTYSDTLVRRFEEEEKKVVTMQEAEDEINIQVIRRFGLGFTDGDYDTLQGEYDSWVERCGAPVDKRQDELYVSICYLKLNLQNSVKNNAAGVGALANSYKAFIEAATTEIEDRKKKAESEMQLSPLGVMIRDIEEHCPADFYKDKSLYADFDHLKEYIQRFMTRPLNNLLTGSKEMDKEFNLSGSEE